MLKTFYFFSTRLRKIRLNITTPFHPLEIPSGRLPWRFGKNLYAFLVSKNLSHFIISNNNVWVAEFLTVLGKGKRFLLQAWTGPWGSRMLRLTDFSWLSSQWRWLRSSPLRTGRLHHFSDGSHNEAQTTMPVEAQISASRGTDKCQSRHR